MTPIEPPGHTEALEQPGGEVIALPAGTDWWRTTMAELQEREAAARRRPRELQLELDAATVERARAEARVTVSDRALARAEAELRSLRAQHRALEGRAERLGRRLAAAESSRAYRLGLRWWRIRSALVRPLRRIARK
jgi:chromosome segregation ATPase